MTAAAWSPAQAAQAGHSPWRLAAAAGAVVMLIIYSQAWLFPIFGDGPDVIEASGLIRALFFPAYLVGLALVAGAPGRTLQALARQPFLLLAVAVAAASYFWSIAPDQTVRRVVAVALTTLGGVAVAVRFRWSELAEVFGACFAALAVMSLAACLLFPSVGVMSVLFPGAWRGLWAEKNAFGGSMALGVVILAAAAALNPQRARLWVGFAALCLGLVLMSTSKTSLVSLMLGLGVLGLTAFARRGPAAKVLTAWVGVFGLVVLGAMILFASDLLLGLLGKDATFTGRTQIWTAAMRQVDVRPWTGFGYGVIWTESGVWTPLARIVQEAGFRPNHAHNVWVEQWLGQGLLGLGAFVLLFAQAIVLGIIAIFRERGALLAAPLLVVYALMTFTESVGMVYNDLRWVLFVVIAVKLAYPDPKPAG